MLLPSRDAQPSLASRAGDERLLEVLLWDGLLRQPDPAAVPPLTQEELAERTGLSRNSVKAYLSTKLKGALDGGDSISLRREAGYALGVDFGGTHEVRVVLTNLQGAWKPEYGMLSPAGSFGDERPEAWRTIRTAVDGIWEAMVDKRIEHGEGPVEPRELVGVGIGIPTPPVPRAGAGDSPFGHWGRWGDAGVMLRDALNRKWEEKERGRGAWDAVEFEEENDTNLSAIADHLWGSGPSSNFTLYIKWQASVRAALILDGRLYKGGDGAAGELPHVKVKAEDPATVEAGKGHRRCGWKACPAGDDCLYAIAPFDEIMKAAEQAGAEITDGNRAGAIVRLAAENEQLRNHLYAAARGIGQALAPLALGVNPEKVVIGGALGARAYPLVLEKLREGVEQKTHAADFLVTNSTIRNRGTVRGAATLALLKFGPAYLKRLALGSGRSASRNGKTHRRTRQRPAAKVR